MWTRKRQQRQFNLVSFLVGLGVGSAIGVLVAPTEGRRAWTELRTVGTRLLHLGRQQATGIAERAGEAASAVREQIGAAVERVSGDAKRERLNAKKSRAAGDGDLLNRATREQLLDVYGIGPVLADRILQGRPYKNARDVVERGIVPERIFEQLRRELQKAQRSA